MSDPNTGRVADQEAADWHVRLGERPVSAATLEAFRVWRTSPANIEAWERIETLWRTTGSLSGDPDIQALTQATLIRTRPMARRNRIRAFGLGSVAAVTVLVAAIAVLFWLPNRHLYVTGIGEQHLVRLDDGSLVRLDTDTRLQVRYDQGVRRIRLDQGQALFTVAHDPSRPFIVTAGPTEVTALGTRFDVRRETRGTRVTLITGAVAVTETRSSPGDPPPRRWQLAPGQQIRTSVPDPEPRLIDPTVETSWSEGRLVFRDTPLGDAVAEVNRYLPDRIVLEPGPLERVSVSGVFTAGDREAFVAAAADLFGLTVSRLPDGGIRLSDPDPAT